MSDHSHTTETLANVEANGLSIGYSKRGSGPPLILMHGGEADHTMFSVLGAYLAASFTVIAYDQRDSGTTRDLAQSPRAYGLADMGDDAAEFIKALGYERANVFGTSLGVDLNTGKAIEGGHRHHMRAINTIARAGSLKDAVDQGVLTAGVMYEVIRHNVDFVLAGSIRDDGPLPDTIMDLRVAQDRYTESLQGVKLVLSLSTMLHGIGVGNMLPSWVRMVCVDINPAVVTKLADRGSSQTIGIVTDVGLFLHRLAQKLKS